MNFRRVKWLWLVVCLCTAAAARSERLPLKVYTVADGLPHNQVNKIVRDSLGFLWFCTADGLSRYDGYDFTNYGTDQGLPHPNVTDILETREGEYWVGTGGGLVRFNPGGTPTRHVVSANSADTAARPMFTVVLPEDNSMQAQAITRLVEDHGGTVWCGTENGLFRLERASRPSLREVDIGLPREHGEQRSISDVMEDCHQVLWIATPAGPYRRGSDRITVRLTKEDGLPDDFIQSLILDSHDRLWVSTRYADFFCLTVGGAGSRPVVSLHYSPLVGLPSTWVFQVLETSEGKFWAAAAGGLVEFYPDKPRRQLHVYDERHGLNFRDVNALSEDSGGNLWLATYAGAARMGREGFVTYDWLDGFRGAATVATDQRGGMCFRAWLRGDGSMRVLGGKKPDSPFEVPAFGHYDGQRFRWFFPGAMRENDMGWVTEGVTIHTRNGEWWIGTGEGIYRFPASECILKLETARPLAVYTTRDGIPNEQVFRIFEDSQGNVWVSTVSPQVNGLAWWDRATATFHDVTNSPGLPSPGDDLARSFGEDRSGNIWIGFAGGLARHRDGRFTLFSAQDGLPPGTIRDIHVDSSGGLWLASSRSGLIRVKNPVSDQPTYECYTTARGLSSNIIQVIAEDLEGRIYAGTGRGLDRLDPATGRIRHISATEGLDAGELLSAFRDRNGALWFGSRMGLLYFMPAPDKPASPATIRITGLQVAGTRRLVSALGEQDIVLPDLDADRNDLQIDFAGLGFSRGEAPRYQYKLEGADSDWNAPTDRRSVNYANLAPGRYRFLVRAVDSDGIGSPAPAVIGFAILPHLWQRWWFLTLAGLSVGLTVYSSHRYRVGRRLELMKMRECIATDLHDDIGSNLTRIAFLSEAAKQQSGGNGLHEENPLSAIARIARESVGSMRDIVWAIDPERDSLLDLVRKMREHADEVFTRRDIRLSFNAPADDGVKLDAALRRDLLLIFKEAVNNAARHSRCSQVTVDLRVDDERVVLEIADDGIGFDPSRQNGGQGLRSMRRRAAALNGTLDVRTGPGTAVMLDARPRRRKI